jgi:hypothetical protein
LFYSGEEKDNNKKNGYIISLFNKDGNIVQGSLGRLASGAIIGFIISELMPTRKKHMFISTGIFKSS